MPLKDYFDTNTKILEDSADEDVDMEYMADDWL